MAVVFITCPNCSDSFPAAQGQLFDATKRLPPDAVHKLNAMRAELTQARRDHKLAAKKTQERTELAALVVNIGKVVEKIAPSLAGFPEDPGDCRSLFEPIDYTVFRGLTRGSIESVVFVDLKSGNASLKRSQRQIRSVVEAGKVSLHVSPSRMPKRAGGRP